MKKIVLSIATVSIFATSSFSLFGVGDIVFDPTQTAKAVLEYAEQGKRWEKHLREWEADFKAITEFRLDGNILSKFTELNTLLSEYGLDMGDLDLNNPKSEIGVYAKQLFESYTLFDDCVYDYFTDDQKRICKNKMVRNVQEIATMSKLSENMTGLLSELNTLNNNLSHAEDIKSSQDITAGIHSTVTSMEAIKIQYEMMVIRNEATKKMEQRQKEQIEKEKRKNSNAFINQSFL